VANGNQVRRITVEVRVGKDRKAATDDPVFLGLRGAAGREFRLAPAKGSSLRRGHTDRFVLAGPDDATTNVEHPELNDPSRPGLDADQIERCYLRKGFEPIPNVRALGEMDDRLEVEQVTVEIEVEGEATPRRFRRAGPVWLGLVAGLSIEIPRADTEA